VQALRDGKLSPWTLDDLGRGEAAASEPLHISADAEPSELILKTVQHWAHRRPKLAPAMLSKHAEQRERKESRKRAYEAKFAARQAFRGPATRRRSWG